MNNPDNVRYCEYCRCKTWHYGKVCEWSDMHMPDKLDLKPHSKPILLLDFDGVIHSYKSGWQGVDIIPDPPVPGVFRWMENAMQYFDIHVYSTRSIDPLGREAMAQYIRKHTITRLVDNLIFVSEKSRAWITIDDRCVCFNGRWDDEAYSPENLLEFVPWNKK